MIRHAIGSARQPAPTTLFPVRGQNLATELSLWPGQSCGRVCQRQFITRTVYTLLNADSNRSFFILCFNDWQCNALQVRFRAWRALNSLLLLPNKMVCLCVYCRKCVSRGRLERLGCSSHIDCSHLGQCSNISVLNGPPHSAIQSAYNTALKFRRRAGGHCEKHRWMSRNAAGHVASSHWKSRKFHNLPGISGKFF